MSLSKRDAGVMLAGVVVGVIVAPWVRRAVATVWNTAAPVTQ